MFGKRQKKKVEDSVPEEKLDYEAIKEAHKKEIENLEKRIRTLSHEAELKEEKLIHLTMLKETRMQLDFEKKEMTMQRNFDSRLESERAKYNDKLQKMLETRSADLLNMYKEVLARLPDLSVYIKKDMK